jgi:hypothetical protein
MNIDEGVCEQRAEYIMRSFIVRTIQLIQLGLLNLIGWGGNEKISN